MTLKLLLYAMMMTESGGDPIGKGISLMLGEKKIMKPLPASTTGGAETFLRLYATTNPIPYNDPNYRLYDIWLLKPIRKSDMHNGCWVHCSNPDVPSLTNFCQNIRLTKSQFIEKFPGVDLPKEKELVEILANVYGFGCPDQEKTEKPANE